MKSIYEYLLNDISQAKFDYDSRFWIEAVTNVTIEGNIEISEDGETWSNESNYKLEKGRCVFLYSSKRSKFIKYTGKFNIGGDIRGLVIKEIGKNTIGDGNAGEDAFAGSDVVDISMLDLSKLKTCYTKFINMFKDCKYLKKVDKDLLKDIKMINTGYCFSGMFKNCTSLTQAPELPAMDLQPGCYANMFEGCTSLIKAPKILPAIQLTDNCYNSMFKNCTSLKKAPKILADVAAKSCCNEMFRNCISLVDVPDLPATQLAYCCYEGMFWGCESLVEAPELPAIKISGRCYYRMFGHCYSLQVAPKLPAKKLFCSCYAYMFSYCKSLKEAPKLPATRMVDKCYEAMFEGCKSLKEAPKLPDKNLAPDCFFCMFMDTDIKIPY